MKIIFSKKDQERLKASGVETVYMFGSRAQSLQRPLSDFDFAFLMNKKGHRRGGKIYDALYEIISPYCKRTLENDVIDIVFLNDAPLELRFHVVRYGRILFDGEPTSRLNFEEKTMIEYCDYRPLLNYFDKAILKSL